jgi:hypothetical protein
MEEVEFALAEIKSDRKALSSLTCLLAVDN